MNVCSETQMAVCWGLYVLALYVMYNVLHVVQYVQCNLHTGEVDLFLDFFSNPGLCKTVFVPSATLK